MRIIGGKDYYDSGLAFGQDEAVRFVRTGDERMSDATMQSILGTRTLSYAGGLMDGTRTDDGARRATRGAFRQEINHHVEVRRDGRIVRHEVSLAQVVLCGTIRNGMHVRAYQPYGTRTDVDARWIWTHAGLQAYVDQHGLVIREGDESVRPQTESAFERMSTTRWFEPRSVRGDALGRLIERRIVVASRAPDDRHHGPQGIHMPWRINQDSLKDIGFAKAVDPYTAFQEISMWVGGVLPDDGPETIQIVDDVIKIQKHGFDHPTSFRRSKAERRS